MSKGDISYKVVIDVAGIQCSKSLLVNKKWHVLFFTTSWRNFSMIFSKMIKSGNG